MMIAIGTANNTPINPKVLAPINIQIKISNELTQSVLFITHGTRMLFSHRWIITNSAQTLTKPIHPSLIAPTNNDGTDHNNGPTYGMISVSPAINAKEKILGISTPNHVSINNPIPVIAKINTLSNSWLLSQNPNFSYIVMILSCHLVLWLWSILRNNLKMLSFSILNNTANVNTNPIWVSTLKIDAITETAIPAHHWMYSVHLLIICLMLSWIRVCTPPLVEADSAKKFCTVSGSRVVCWMTWSSHCVCILVCKTFADLSQIAPISPNWLLKKGIIISTQDSNTPIKIKYDKNIPRPLLPLSLRANHSTIWSTAIDSTNAVKIKYTRSKAVNNRYQTYTANIPANRNINDNDRMVLLSITDKGESPVRGVMTSSSQLSSTTCEFLPSCDHQVDILFT